MKFLSILLVVFLYFPITSCKKKKEEIKTYTITYELSSSTGAIANYKYTNSTGGLNSSWDFVSNSSTIVVTVTAKSNQTITFKAAPDNQHSHLKIKALIDGSLKAEAEHSPPTGWTSTNIDSWVEISFVLD